MRRWHQSQGVEFLERIGIREGQVVVDFGCRVGHYSIPAGKAGKLKAQSELFADPVGHPAKPLQVLVAYCYDAVIYRRSPVGLSMPGILSEWYAEMVRVLQEVAWDAVRQHPLNGVCDAGRQAAPNRFMSQATPREIKLSVECARIYLTVGFFLRHGFRTSSVA